MARRMRKRTIAAAVVTVVLAVITVGSFCWRVYFINISGVIILLEGGTIACWCEGIDDFVTTRSRWAAGIASASLQMSADILLPRIDLRGITKYLNLPLWPFLAIAAFFAVRWYRQDHRVPLGCCACGYDLTGNRSGRCPECGRTVAGTERTP